MTPARRLSLLLLVAFAVGLSVYCLLVALRPGKLDRDSRTVEEVLEEQRREYKDRRAKLKAKLTNYLGLPFKTVIQQLNLGEAKINYIVEEPPGTLRGAAFTPLAGGEIMVLIDESDPWYRFDMSMKSVEIDDILEAKVGGIKYYTREIAVAVGNIPFWWRLLDDE